MITKRGDVYMADLSGNVVGAEQGGVRPVLIIQNDIGNRFSPTVIVACITARIIKAKLPTHVHLTKGTGGLERDSVVLLEQIKTIDKSRLIDKIGFLDSGIMEKVDFAFSVSGGIAIHDNFERKIKPEYENFYRFILGEKVQGMTEDTYFEFKELKEEYEELESLLENKVAMYVTAFLNSGGGKILFGIRDNDEVVTGISIKESEKKLIKDKINGLIGRIKPPVSVDHYKIIFNAVYDSNNKIIEGIYVLEVFVPASHDPTKIYYDKNYIHIKGDATRRKITTYKDMEQVIEYVRDRVYKEINKISSSGYSRNI